MHRRIDGLGYASGVDREEILRVLRAFERAGLEYVLIGATALGFHGIVRATEDVDLFVRATPENIERLKTALREATTTIRTSTRSAARIFSVTTPPSGITRQRATCTSTC